MGVLSRAFRNLSRRKVRSLLVVIALGFCMAILIAVPPGITANQNATKNLTGNLGDTITQTEAAINKTLTQIECTHSQDLSYGGMGDASGTSPSGNSDSSDKVIYGTGAVAGGSLVPMNESKYTDISNITGVAAVEPMLQVVEGHTQTAQGVTTFTITIPDYIITGVPLDNSLIDNYPILPTNITSGRNLQAGDTGDVVISENCSAYFNAKVGDTINILGKDFKVVGIYSPSGVSDSQLVYMNLDDAQAVTNSTDLITQLNVFADNKDDVTSIANALYAQHEEIVVETSQQRLSQLQQMESMYGNQLKSAQDAMNQTQIQAVEEIGIAVTATSVIVLFVMLYTVRERTKEIGTLKAMGASNVTVMSQFVLEGVMLSVLAGAVGVALGAVAAPYLASMLLPTIGHSVGIMSTGSGAVSSTGLGSNSVTVSADLMAIGFGTSVLLGAIGSLYPAWRAAKIRPAEAMRYE